MPWSLRYIVIESEAEPDVHIGGGIVMPSFGGHAFRGTVSTSSRRQVMDALDEDWEPFATVLDGYGAIVMWFRRMDRDASLEQIDPKDLPGFYL